MVASGVGESHDAPSFISESATGKTTRLTRFFFSSNDACFYLTGSTRRGILINNVYVFHCPDYVGAWRCGAIICLDIL